MSGARRPDGRRRMAALVALVLLVAVAVETLGRVVADPLRVVVEVALLTAFLAAAWLAVTRTGAKRLVATALVVIWLVVVGAGADDYLLVSLLVRLGALGVAVALGRFALNLSDAALSRSQTPGTPVPPATRGVLFMNLKSGGGKAERFHLVDECRKRGIEPVVLEAGEDWLQTVRDVAGSGVDVLGMAGGDGSQAMVGTVAAELGLPMVVVPAGTRNHLALDLGLDRDDVVGALDAYGDAVERTVDLADLNGHVFVNNVSLGIYAAIVRSPEYRDAKVDTTLATVPQVLGPDTEPFDLRFTDADGARHDGAHLIQISNNPYGTVAGARASRPRLDTHELGVVALVLGEDAGPAKFLGAVATGHPERFPGLTSWATPAFEVDSGAPIEIGLDGESMVMDPPLRFAIRPVPVRLRLPSQAFGYSKAARVLGLREAVRELWQVLLGHPARFDAGPTNATVQPATTRGECPRGQGE